MAQARELRRRIKSVQSTRQITRTMEMVSTSKLKRAQDRVIGARPYAVALGEVLGELYAPDLAERFPLLRRPEAGAIHRAAVLLITSNRGLCGAFNANLIREARRRVQALEEQGARVDLHLVGRKGVNFFRFAKRAAASTRIDETASTSCALAWRTTMLITWSDDHQTLRTLIGGSAHGTASITKLLILALAVLVMWL